MSQQVSPIGEKPLTRYEAQQLVERIRKGVDLLRSLLVELRDREGWKALGYDSWRSCVVGEFGKSEAYLYRQLAAARVENNLKDAASRGEISPMGEKPLPERVIRPLAKVPPDEQPTIWEIARDEYGPEPTGKQVKQVVKSLSDTPKVSPIGEKQREAKPARPVVEDAKVIDERPPKRIDEPKAPPRLSAFDHSLQELEAIEHSLIDYISLKASKELKDIYSRLRNARYSLRLYSPTATGPAVDLPDWIDSESWDYFVVLRGKLRKPMTARAAQSILERLAEYRALGDDPNEVIEQSIRNSWQDVFPLRKDNSQKEDAVRSYEIKDEIF